ncbi:MAG: HNH endonuclease [Candidatus Latescibacteria bacterium]|nr:HNH endonuclease [Candidatus Latescibacterota bacterium]
MVESYIKRFAKLHTDTSSARWSATTRHQAPHKPLLLLSVIDLFAQGSITTNLIELTPDLGELFTLYWARVMPPDQHGNLALPFFHLKSDGFWHLIPRSGKEAVLAAAQQIRSLNQLRETIFGAKLDEELYTLLGIEEIRHLLRTMLIETYFSSDVQPKLVEQGMINAKAFQYSQTLLERVRTEQLREEPAEEEYQPAARNQGFRRAVVIAYDHRCALCGIRLLTPDGHTVVDAAHIIPWSISHSDDPRNGMALCRLCHWNFDEGLMSVSSQYVVISSPQLGANHNIPGYLLTVVGRRIIGPDEQILWPDLDSLIWHRQKVFRRR